MKKLSLLFALIFTSALAFAQAGGFLEGTVRKGGKPLAGVVVEAKQGGLLSGSDKTDNFGKYNIKPLSAGEYVVTYSFAGLETYVETIMVSGGSGTTNNITMVDKKSNVIKGARVTGQKPRKIAIDVNKVGELPPLDAKKIEKLATTNTLDALALKGGGYQAKKGAGVVFAGGRAENTIYIVDGIIVRGGNVQTNPGYASEIKVNIGGLPANLGDATGGVVTITTKGAASNHQGSINMQHSVDGFNNNQLNVNLRGPLWKKIVPGTTTKRPVLGYSLSLGGQYDKDPDPSYYKYYRVNDAKLAELQANPLRAVKSASGAVIFRNAAEFITDADLIRIKARENGFNHTANLAGKIIFAPTKDIEMTIGGSTQFSANPGYSNGNAIFTPEANGISNYFLGRTYLRFRQTLSKDGSTKTDAEKVTPLIGKAFYSVQLNYEKSASGSKHPVHGDNIFAYGYLGKFKQNYRNYYSFDTVAGGYYGLRFQGQLNDSFTFVPNDTYNPNYTAYTKYVYNSLDQDPRTLNDLLLLGGLANGGTPNSVFQLHNNVGMGVGSTSKSQVEQYSLNVDASFDINTGVKRSKALNMDMRATHQIEFGMYYEQRLNRNYGLNARGIWELMRSITNAHILDYDYANPIFRVDGQNYTLADVQNGVVQVSQFDTINYNRKLSAENPESYFSKNLRAALGLGANNRDFINIDEVDPSILKLNMFSADDLLNQGSQYVGYSGYDYLGNKVKGRPSFQDFWTKKDANGNFTRPITPFNPIYVAGYIQDNFKFKDIRFRLGMRIDRYDANQKVLRDPYSLVSSLKVSDLESGKYSLSVDGDNGNAAAPDPILNADFNSKFKDASVYVDNNELNKPKIVGYRIGDVWYDPFGREISDPAIINSKYTNGSQLAPFIANKNDIKKTRIKDADYDVNSAFTDYKPRVNVSPRITFSFPVDVNKDGRVKSLFYAHYDVVYQRPSAGYIYSTPDDYFFISERGQSQTLANANLNPEKKVDYEFGFQQQVSPSSQMKISAAYIERRNQVQLQRILAAYPISYETYGNRDFSSVKQMICEYELRPDPEHIPLELTVAYTLQFAEGTGSNATSQRSLISSGQPNLRTVQPLDIDSRHTIMVNADYRLGSAEGKMGPKIGKVNPFKNTGINMSLSGRSGEPYTRLAQVQSLYNGFGGSQISGTLNGSRRPWTFNVDARVDKDISFSGKGKKLADGTRSAGKTLGLNVYATVQNVLNTRNVLAVYNYTGSADNDGFIGSPQGDQYVKAIQTSAASWQTLYGISLRNPGRFVNPRRIYVGFNFNF